MFKAVLSDSNILKTSFDAISSIVDEVQMQTDDDGLKLDALDRSHITFIHLELKSDVFDEYKCEEPLKINVDTEELMKVLKRSKMDDMVEISVDEGNLIITFEGEARRTFKIRLIDIEYEAPAHQNWNIPLNLKYPSISKNSIQDIDIVSDKISLIVDQINSLPLQRESLEATIEYVHGEKIEDKAKSVFSLRKSKRC